MPLVDEPHPTEEGRTKMGDLQNAMEDLSKKMEKRGKPDEMSPSDMRAAFRSVVEEYGHDFTPDPDASRMVAKWQGLKDRTDKALDDYEAAHEAAVEAGEVHSDDEDAELTRRWFASMKKSAEADPDKEGAALTQEWLAKM